MTRRLITLLASLAAFVILVVASGCSTGARTADESPGSGDPALATAEDSLIHTRAVYVLVDGREKGTLPATLRVKRSFGVRMISLRQAGEEIRTYELQTTYTADSIQLHNSFFGSSDATSVVYDVTTLPTDDENEFLVPYSRYPITVEDRQFNLVLIVEE